MIVKYTNITDYNSAGIPTTESRVAHVNATEDVKIDGVNIVTETPVCGDAVYHNGSKVVFFKGGNQLNHTALTSDGYTKVGEVVGRIGNKALCIHNASQGSLKYCACVQWAITAIASTSITIKLTMVGDYTTPVQIPVTLTSATVDATSASEIAVAIEAAGNTDNVGYDKHHWWAFYDEDNSRIIIQCDVSGDYRQYSTNIAGTGSNITASLIVWDDMPVSDKYWKTSGANRTGGGIMNQAKGYAYYSENGSTPSANVSLTEPAGPVNLTSFTESEYCADLRLKYGDYETYLKENQSVMFPLKGYGAFGLPDAKTLTYKYGNDTFTMKDGTVAYKYPALHSATTVGFDNVDGIEIGDWYLPGVYEGTMLMKDETLAAINATADKNGSTKVLNTAYRWFALRCSSSGAWHYSGGSGILGTNLVYGTITCLAVTLLNI